MDERQARLLTVLSAVLLVLVALLVWAKPPPDRGEDGATAETWDPAFPDVEVSALEITGTSGALRLEKRDSDWWLTAPVEVRADTRKVDDLIHALTELEISAPLHPGDQGLEAFGLATPIRVRLESSTEPHVLEVGSDAPVGSKTYIRVAGESAVRASRTRLRDAVSLGPEVLRDHAVVHFERSAIESIVIDDTLVLRADDLGWWVERKNTVGSRRADDDRVRSFLQELLDIRADDFPAPDAWANAIVADSHRIDVRSVDTASPPTVVTIDQLTGDAWRVSGPEQALPVRVHVAPLPSLDLDFDPWTSTELVPVRDAQLSALRLTMGDTRYEARRSDGIWDDPRAEALLAALRNAKADRSRVIDVAGSLPVGEIALEEDGRRNQTVHLYDALESGDVPVADVAEGPAFVVARSEMRGIVQAIDPPATTSSTEGSAPAR